MKKKMRKVLVLGSGAIKIGQAGEFDYSGSQAIKALKEEGIETVVINPNIATIQTSVDMADRIYFLPVTPEFTEKVIAREKPDGILLAFGGQTALNTGVALHEKGVLMQHGVEVLGTPVDAILDTEDRKRFVRVLDDLGFKTPVSRAVTDVDQAVEAAGIIGYPVMCRIAYALGGLGSGIARNKKELKALVTRAFSHSGQVLIEECLRGWKELEYEVVRDASDNCIVICSMENLDPMGIHTGESVVVAPVQTLSASEHFLLRSISIGVIRKLGIIGESNIQFALDPQNGDYRIIEVNARLSRSSALASKATGYPLAFVAAKLSLGYSLTDLKNSVTGTTSACFEPALDYIVLKFPRWDLQKFSMVDPVLGSEMKSVGEVMAIGRSFEEVIQKAIRMLETGMNGLVANNIEFGEIESEMIQPTDRRLFAIAEALGRGYGVERVSELTGVDAWFIHRIKSVADTALRLGEYANGRVPRALLAEAKRKGFSDRQISTLAGGSEEAVRKRRKKAGIVPVVKQIDTMAAEYPAKTNYLYLTYNGDTDDPVFGEKQRTVVIGGGPYRIGSSVEFDWCCVNSVLSLDRNGEGAIMINCNPETVSTDYDICERLYFEELSLERVLDICDKESPSGVIVSMGGQIPNNLANPLYRAGIPILGTTPDSIDRAENRHRFSALLDEIGVDQPRWKELTSLEEAEAFADDVGYPVLVRPSYVLSGAAMSIALNRKELHEYLRKASEVSPDHPTVITRFLSGAKEIEIDAVAKDGKLVCYAISEHVENAGVHSGDATIVLPPQRTYLETMRRVKLISKRIAGALEITGPFNIQFLARDNDVKVIECNLRASRSFPFVSKVLGIDFIDMAVKIMLGLEVRPPNRSSFDLDYVGVKAPQFSFTRLKGSDPVLGVEMVSTGEVACLGDDFNEAFLKSLLSVGFRIPGKGILLSTGPVEMKVDFLDSARMMAEAGYKFYATAGTARFMKDHGFRVKTLYWPDDRREPNTLTYIGSGKIDLVINIPKNTEKNELDNDYHIRRKAVDFEVPLITDMQLAKRFAEAICRAGVDSLNVKCLDEYH